MSSTVLNVAGYPVDLDDGRTLAPLERTEIDASLPHNRVLILSGALLVEEGMRPRTTQPDRLISDAAKTQEEER